MSDEFAHDLQACHNDLASSREQLLAVVRTLTDGDLDRGKRGQWTVSRVLQHVIESEWLYSRVLRHLRSLPVPSDAIDAVPESASDAVAKLDASHAAILEALDGVDEETFYKLATLGHEEYSVISMVENDAMHDREHAEQLRNILAQT